MKEKQIEEMAKDLCPLYKEYKSCNSCDAVIDIGDEPCVYKCMAEMILDKGYRKASEVAREIFEEIDSSIDLVCAMTGLDIIVGGKYAELKKKYTEDGK